MAETPSGEPLAVSELGREWGRKLLAASEGSLDPRRGMAAMGAMFGGAGATARAEALGQSHSPALRTLLNDPVAGSLGEPLFAPVAAAIPGDLIATIPDGSLPLLARLVADEKSTGARAIAALEASPSLLVTRDGTLTIIGASTPARLHREFADRRALKDLVAAIERTGYLRLEDAAKYAFAQRSAAGAANLGAPVATLLQGKSTVMFGLDPLVSEFETLRIYAALGSGQRAALAAGGSVPFSGLNGDAADALDRLLYDSLLGPTLSIEEMEPPKEDGPPGDTAALLSAMMGRGAERTVRFAEGVPRDGFLTMTSDASETYRMTDSATGATAFGGAETLGFLRGAKDLPFFRAFVGSANYDRFTPAKSRTLGFKFHFAPKIASSHTLQDHEIAGTASLTYDQMPAAFREAVEESAKVAAELKAPPGPGTIKP